MRKYCTCVPREGVWGANVVGLPGGVGDPPGPGIPSATFHQILSSLCVIPSMRHSAKWKQHNMTGVDYRESQLACGMFIMKSTSRNPYLCQLPVRAQEDLPKETTSGMT